MGVTNYLLSGMDLQVWEGLQDSMSIENNLRNAFVSDGDAPGCRIKISVGHLLIGLVNEKKPWFLEFSTFGFLGNADQMRMSGTLRVYTKATMSHEPIEEGMVKRPKISSHIGHERLSIPSPQKFFQLSSYPWRMRRFLIL